MLIAFKRINNIYINERKGDKRSIDSRAESSRVDQMKVNNIHLYKNIYMYTICRVSLVLY